MGDSVFVVKHEDQLLGPFLPEEAAHFTATLSSPFEIIRLIVPDIAGESAQPLTLRLLEPEAYLAHIDGAKVDTKVALAAILQEFYFVRRDARVFTAGEMSGVWKTIYRISCAVESLMHHGDAVVAEANSQNLAALRLALWRNRDADDFDPHYRDRFW